MAWRASWLVMGGSGHSDAFDDAVEALLQTDVGNSFGCPEPSPGADLAVDQVLGVHDGGAVVRGELG
eukprot:1575888-Pyramimonas_sp.AAC.1